MKTEHEAELRGFQRRQNKTAWLCSVLRCKTLRRPAKGRERPIVGCFSERLCTASGAYEDTSPDLMIILHLKLVHLLLDISEKN